MRVRSGVPDASRAAVITVVTGLRQLLERTLAWTRIYMTENSVQRIAGHTYTYMLLVYQEGKDDTTLA
jgi:hypothetical protein